MLTQINLFDSVVDIQCKMYKTHFYSKHYFLDNSQ